MSRLFSRVGYGSIRASTAVASRPKTATVKTNPDFVLRASAANANYSSRSLVPNSGKGNFFTSTLNSTHFGRAPAGSIFADRAFYIPSEKERAENPQLLLELLRTMTPKNSIRYLDSNPVFLRAFSSTGFVDTDIVSSVSVSLTPAELQKFLSNFTCETNLFTTINQCTKISDFETKLLSIIPIERVIYWRCYENAEYLYSEKNKIVVARGESILNNAIEKADDIFYKDCLDAPYFSKEFDASIVIGFKTMALLPVRSENKQIVGILQFIGFKRAIGESETEFTPYYTETLKIIRTIFEKKFAKPQIKGIPVNITQIFKGIDRCSIKTTSQTLIQFFVSNFKCTAADVYEFSPKTNTLTRLTDGQTFKEEEGGVSYESAKNKSTIFIPDKYEKNFAFFNEKIDGELLSRSILSTTMQYMQRLFVVTLRGKEELSTFTPEDGILLSSLSPIITDVLRVATWLDGQSRDDKTTSVQTGLAKVACKALESSAEKGNEPWKVLSEASMKLFGSDLFYVASFDGRNITLTPGGATCKFEECAAGLAFNYRDTLRTKKGEQNFNEKMYENCGVEVKETLAFPYKANGRIAGAIEIINPKEEIPPEAMTVFSDLLGLLYVPNQK
ncbi:hypothetical protein TVAG_330570 [Trichomonas vaginalis G3]|uniref:GAF domain-containing protein n=1 Tax=Trichomonas vaginalis (strain ATCC PRA-98 / G3) TaxID=412133 RepID=A2F4M3_TRIV3|nr:hypothetical protein TVAGG3_0583380 [Trichomonas vaginalis G3]EAY00128.1 hypothetical protein TVAG_330570 [Trichomonas vaginalis G3]KAI5522730.1 hypothetical protein TVAGG3_0583380 [Trichomonas vaginalis G3]|eukprot:XP_001313057.1 hypothetical protein [Trichomonas vaginalis G3]